jgi:succinate dehydrogenase/fumarate reductase cytochrome b subunit
MKKALAIISLFPILPTIALAQTLSAQGFIAGFLAFTNSVLIPFLLGFAFLFFVFNAFRFFIVNGSNEEGQKNAKNLAVYGVLAFVVLIIFWGVVNLLASSVGFNEGIETTPDYVEKNEGKFIAPTRTATPADNARDPACGTLEQQFDNTFGGPCSTNGNTGQTNTPSEGTLEQDFDKVFGGPSTNTDTPTANQGRTCILPNGKAEIVTLEDCRSKDGVVY